MITHTLSGWTCLVLSLEYIETLIVLMLKSFIHEELQMSKVRYLNQFIEGCVSALFNSAALLIYIYDDLFIWEQLFILFFM